jgi:multiple sugar transport system substrate-binding protein
MRARNNGVSRTRLSRRSFLRLAGVGSGAALLSACGGTPQTDPASSASGAASGGAAPAEKVALSFWTPGGSEEFCKGFDTIAANYKQLNPNIDIGPTQCGTGDDDFNELLLARIAGGNPPDATILWTSPVAFGARGALEPLDDLMQSSQNAQVANWPAGVLASCQFQGITYGLPVTSGSYAVFYNQELFEAKGIAGDRASFPKSWDELRKLSKEFTRWNGDALESAGFLPQFDAVTLTVWSALNGGQFYDAANNRHTIDSEPNIAMMQYLLDWLDEEYQGDYSKIAESAGWDMDVDSDGLQPAWQEGRLAMAINGSWASGDLYQVQPAFEAWNVAPLPVGPGGSTAVSGYWPNWLVIPKGSKQREAAFQYLDYMSVEGVKVWFANIPDLPVNSKVSNDLVMQSVTEKRGEEFARDLTNFFREQLTVATPMWTSPIQDFADDQILRAYEQVMSKAASPKDALTEAQQACEAQLAQVLKG